MKKLLALILSLAIVISSLTVVVFAEGSRPVKTKFYLHYKNSSTSTKYDMIALSSKGQLEAGDYVVSLRISNTSSYSSFFISGMENRTAMNGRHTPHHSVNTSVFPGTTALSNSAGYADSNAGLRTYSFTLTEEQAAYKYQYFGFYMAKNAGVEFELYISDFIVYKADDASKTNLLDTNDYKTNLKNWYGDFYSGTELMNVARFVQIGYVPYSEETVDINLNNSLYKLTNATEGERPTFKVGFIGGSVTNGTGASDANATSWRARTRDWIKNTFPTAEVTEVEAAIGATGSFYGVYRADKHLIMEKAPDLCFIEYAINDAPGYDAIFDNTIHNNYSNLESIINKIYASNPYADIVLVVTGDRTWLQSEATSQYPIFGTTHTELAQYYSLPVIYVGRELAQDIYVENGNVWPDADNNPVWAKYYTDYVHPTDLGYEHYANTVTTYLEGQWLGKDNTTIEYINKTQSELFPNKTFVEVNDMGKLYLDADIIYPNELNSAYLGGFTCSESGEYYPLVSKAEGDSITLEFNSSNFGIWVYGKPAGTNFTYSIDGGEEITKTIKTNYLSACMMLAEGLDNSKTHNITITHDDSNDLDIRYFLMSEMIEGQPATLEAVDKNEVNQKTMLHIGYNNKGTGHAYDMVGLSTKGKLDAGDYVVSFTKDSGYSNVTSFLILGTPSLSSMSGKTIHHATKTAYFSGSPVALTDTGSGNRVEYKFTLTQEQATHNYQRFGFYFDKAAGVQFDINIADLTVYRADDASKTNLLNSDKYKTDLDGWASDYQTGENVASVARFDEFEYITYRPDFFKTGLKINITRSATASGLLEFRLAQKVKGALEAGKEYTFEFNYYKPDNSVDFPIVTLYGFDSGSLSGAKVLRSNRYFGGTKFGGDGITANKVKFTFTLTDTEANYSLYSIGFYPLIPAGANYYLYLSNFTLYETEDTYKTNLMCNDNYVNTVNNWQYPYGSFSGSVSAASANATLSSIPYGSGDATDDGIVDICDLVKLCICDEVSSSAMSPMVDMDDNAELNMLDVWALYKRILSSN